MKCLLRTKVDRFELADSHKLSELEALMKAGRIEEVLLPVDDVFAACPAVRVKPESDRLIRNGTLPATKLVGTRHWKIPYNALPNYVSGSIIAKF